MFAVLFSWSTNSVFTYFMAWTFAPEPLPAPGIRWFEVGLGFHTNNAHPFHILHYIFIFALYLYFTLSQTVAACSCCSGGLRERWRDASSESLFIFFFFLQRMSTSPQMSTLSCTFCLCSNFGVAFALYLLPCFQEKIMFCSLFLKAVPVE